MIENYQRQIDFIVKLLNQSLLQFSDYVNIEYYNPEIIKSGINLFDIEKKYIDTSSVEGVNNISDSENITFQKRPSRANMQPMYNSVWFAKMKGSNKNVIITEQDDDIVNKCILSTGFQGIKATKKLPLSFLTSIVISGNFKIQRDNNSVGTTMAGINNETFMKIQVPLLSDDQIYEYNKKYAPMILQLSFLRKKINELNKTKKTLLDKYFD